MTWTITTHKKISCSRPICIEGLPGVGNVGKIVVDFILDQFDVTKLATFSSPYLPNSVFVTPTGVQLPLIEIYHVTIAKKDVLLVAGDAQPTNEKASYELTESILEFIKNYGCKSCVALGGIGLPSIPKNPRVFAVSNDINALQELIQYDVQPNAFGIVGPIVGVSGLLLGLSQKHNISSLTLLGETCNHPTHIGFGEAKKILHIINSYFSLQIDESSFDKELNQLQTSLQDEPEKFVSKQKQAKKITHFDLSYIG
ncbi:MAG: PAC2 family protein [Candidatus Nanoarchaeia archaeon]